MFLIQQAPERDSIKLELFSRCRYINLQAQLTEFTIQRDGGQRPKVTDEILGCMANDGGREGGNMSALDRWLGETRKEEPWSVYSRTPDA
ncbi:hypothetical protein IG631_04973 [Alternaria alternata]|nr:hypothetical protein IG631_04973 [Alternaria alternata]